MALWESWARKAGDAIVDLGSPLGESHTIPPAAAPVGAGQVGGFSILQGQSFDAVANLLEDHPHFHSPGASIEVIEFLSMPGA